MGEQERLGLTVGTLMGPIRDTLEMFREAETLGYTDVWSEEAAGTEGFSPLAAVATVTSTMRLGTAIVPVFTRPPPLLAMSAATLQDISGGRFVLGLGTSSSIIVEQWMDGSFAKPLTRLREYVEAIREILTGKKVTFEGETIQLNRFRLMHEAGTKVPIYLAALGPSACRLAGRVADGVIFFLKTPDGVRRAIEWVKEGALEAGRAPSEIDTVIRVPAAVDEDPELLDFLSRRLTVAYAQVDVYNRSLAQQGYEEEAKAISEAWSAGERDRATELVSAELMDSLYVYGDRETCLRKLQAFRDAGIKTPVLFVNSVAGDPEERRERVRSAIKVLAPVG